MAILKDTVNNIGKVAPKTTPPVTAVSGAGLGAANVSPTATKPPTQNSPAPSWSGVRRLAKNTAANPDVSGASSFFNTLSNNQANIKDTGVDTGSAESAPVSKVVEYNNYAQNILSGQDRANSIANASADSIIGTPEGAGITAKETQMYDPNYSGDFMQAYKTYGGNKGANLYDFMTTGSQEDWQSFVTDPAVKRFYADDYAKFGDLSDNAAMNQFYNQFTADDFIGAYDNDAANSAQLYRDIVGDDASATTAINTALYNNGLITPYSDSQTGIVSFDDQDAIAALDYSILMQQLGAAGVNPDAMRSAYSDYEAKYLGRYGGNFLNTGEGAELLELGATNPGFTGGYGYINDANQASLERALGNIYGFNSSIPTATEFNNAQTNGGMYKNPKFTDYLSSRLTIPVDTGADAGEEVPTAAEATTGVGTPTNK